MPPPPERGHIECCRCGDVLERRTGRSLDGALACAITTLVLLVPANIMTLLTVHAPAGLVSNTRLFAGIQTIWHQGWPLLAAGIALEALFLPFARFGLLSAVLVALRQGRRGRWIGPVFRIAQSLDDWAMADVLLIGAAVGWGRVEALIPVRIDFGGWCLVTAAALTMLTRATLDRRAVWRRIEAPPTEIGPHPVACIYCDLVLPGDMTGKRCPRCSARLHRREPRSLSRSISLAAAGWALFPVSNYFPMSALWKFGIPHPHTIFAGVVQLFENGFAPLGILIFCTSIGIPAFKLSGLTWFFVSIHRRSTWRLRLKTKVYRVVEAIGRWSNLDPFTILIYAPMVQYRQLAHIDVHGGASAFLACVVISMLAARSFDPRLMWDAGSAQRPEAAPSEASIRRSASIWKGFWRIGRSRYGSRSAVRP